MRTIQPDPEGDGARPVNYIFWSCPPPGGIIGDIDELRASVMCDKLIAFNN